ncbi:MAG TPA: glycogen debranching N-terminal domain-containing protein [Woeseiaceae bacterium]|nr:glycogen debranching N-terminal domain-containing protein [Woeseiaceae bacterium]
MSDHIFMAEVVQPVLIKNGGLFLSCQGDGDITVVCGSGLGLFYRDTRYLSCYELRLGGKPPLTLMTSAARGDQSVHELTNAAIPQLDGANLAAQSLGLRLERTVDGEALSLLDRLVLRSFTAAPIAFCLTVTVEALFEDLFELRGAEANKRGPPPKYTESERGLAFRYHGADGINRSLVLAFSRVPRLIHRHRARVAAFDFSLGGRGREALDITFSVAEEGKPISARPPKPEFYSGVHIESDNAVLDRVMERSLRDLAMLRTGLESNFIAGGMPWFVAPFGRDSILAALQTLVFDPRPAEGVARLFAKYQGGRDNPETGEQPGKIPHELRLGAMAHLNEVPHRPSYLSIDSTALFLILVGRHAEWTGNLRLFEELRPAIDAALDWINREVEGDENGYLSYRGETPEGPINQGWKDSTRGVPRKDGSMPHAPIALCEVQGYVYLAQILIAAALRRAGEDMKSDRLEDAAEALRKRFNRDFWMEDEGCYALALEKGARQVTVVTSNAGQALWSGIAEAEKAARTAARMLRSDMECGWGIRTLSNLEKTYNPLNYHLGSVWPFDNSLIVDGFRRYGLDAAAVRIFDALLDAAGCFALGRLPEFYVGFAREPDLFPARCPFAEPMQAWSSGAIPYMLMSLLGMRAGRSGPEFDRPMLPGGVGRLSIRGITLAAERFDCDFTRGPAGAIRSKSCIAQ